MRQGGKRLTTAIFVSATQFRLGLCVTALRPHEATPHEADYLGDFELNRMDRHGPHNAVLDVWVRAYRAAAHAVTVVKGDKQEGTQVAARFDANTVVDILCELMGGRLVGVELKCLHTVKSTYGKGMRSSHCDNGHVYAFGNTQEAVLRRIRGARRQGELTDGFFNHATGLGHITGVDWPPTILPADSYSGPASPTPSATSGARRGEGRARVRWSSCVPRFLTAHLPRADCC